jgi:vacuolar-type H+-ATPase subunit H
MSQFQSAPDPAGNQRIREASERVRHTAREKADAIKREAEEKAEQSKSEVAGRAFTIANAIRTAGRELDAQGEPLGAIAEIAGDKVAELSRYLDDHSAGELIGDMESIARRQPWFFVGGAFAIGLLAGRFIKAGAGQTDRGAIGPHEDYALTTESDYALATGTPQQGFAPGGSDGFDV